MRIRTIMLVATTWTFTGCGSPARTTPPPPPDDAGTTAPDSGATDIDAGCGTACSDCTGVPGTFRSQSISVGDEERFYWMHVPDSYSCDAPMPVLVDLHGTAGPMAEEAYALADIRRASDEHGFIAIRPRSRFSDEGGLGPTYRWDQNPGDLELNATFIKALVEHVAVSYSLDRARLYLSGFSSGTNMTAVLLTDRDSPFSGYGMVGGGTWEMLDLPAFEPAATPRIYDVTGYRDYMFQFERRLLAQLDAAGFPRDHVFLREVDTGHELYGWHFDEIWSWLDAGTRPADGALASHWSREPFPGDTSLVELARTPDGNLVASGTGGAIWMRDAASAMWSRKAELSSRGFAPAFAGVCIAPSGTGFAVGEGTIARTTDSGATWTIAPAVPELQGTWFGVAYLNTIACGSDGSAIGAGYWSGARSGDGGASWEASNMMLDAWDIPAQIAAVEIAATGTVVSVGYAGYIGRSSDGRTFTQISSPLARDWYTAAASAPGGNWWIVGEHGAILHSTDDGVSFADQTPPAGFDEDLYSVAFWDERTGLAVGAHGAALYTTDGGATWQDVSTALDAYLGDVAFLAADHALVVGEHGTVLTFTP